MSVVGEHQAASSAGGEEEIGGSARIRERWIGVLAGLALAAVDTFSAAAFGVRFDLNGRDVTILVWAYFGISFATLGFVIGYTIEAKRRVQATAALLQAAQVKLAQNEKLATLGQLAAAIAHEVRNPLAIIRSSVQNLAEGVPANDEESKKSCAFVTEEIDRLTRVTASLLGFVRPLHVKTRPIAVKEVFDRTALLAAAVLGPKKLHLKRDESGTLPSIEADPDLLCQALLGLLANAAEATPEGGEVTLEAHPSRSTDLVELAVADSGPGVAPELRSRIFEPFFTTRREGHGLGLAVVRQIVQAHGGRIEVGERPGGGARFLLQLRTTAEPGGGRDRDRSAA